MTRTVSSGLAQMALLAGLVAHTGCKGCDDKPAVATDAAAGAALLPAAPTPSAAVEPAVEVSAAAEVTPAAVPTYAGPQSESDRKSTRLNSSH